MKNNLTKHRRSHARLLVNYVTSVNDCMLEMATYVDIMIYNIDVYESNRGWRICRNYTPPGQRGSYIYAHQDIDNINKAAIKCIDIIDKHVMPK